MIQVSSVIKLLRDYDKLMLKRVDVVAVTIPSTQVPANSSVKLYEDKGDLIFIYSPPNWTPYFNLQVNSDVVSYSIPGDQLYYNVLSIIASGRTVITVNNSGGIPLSTNPITIIKFVFRKA